MPILFVNPKAKDISTKFPNYKVTKVVRKAWATIVFFDDGTKSVVRLRDTDEDDPYVAVCCAIAKRAMGSGTAIRKLVDQIEYAGEPVTKRPRQHIHVDRDSDVINYMLDELFDRTFSRSVL